MSDKKPRAGRKSDRPPQGLADQLKAKRAEFVSTFFKKGAEFTEELLGENRKLHERITQLERENAQLRTQLASDTAIRDLLSKIRQLEKEKEALLSSMHEAEAVTGRFANRFQAIEAELENFANLYVASYQLHSTLRLPTVIRHLKELLHQLVGAEVLAFYFASNDGRELVPLITEGIDVARLPRVPVHTGGDAAENLSMAAIERAFLTGVMWTEPPAPGPRSDGAAAPIACVPLRFDDEVVGVIAVYALLEQKPGFLPVDHELFKLLGAHAACALFGGLLLARAGGKVPELDMLREIASSCTTIKSER